MFRNLLKNTSLLSKNTRKMKTNQFLFMKNQETETKYKPNKEGLDFFFGKPGQEDIAHPNTKHMDLPEEEFGKYWRGVPSIHEVAVGLERAEIIDPFYFDELLVEFFYSNFSLANFC
jgi:hypothetical protein